MRVAYASLIWDHHRLAAVDTDLESTRLLTSLNEIIRLFKTYGSCNMSEGFLLLETDLSSWVARAVLVLVHLHCLLVDLDRGRRSAEKELLAYVVLG